MVKVNQIIVLELEGTGNALEKKHKDFVSEVILTKVGEEMKVYLVGEREVEGNYVDSVHETYKGAVKAWNKRRLVVLKERQESLKQQKLETDNEKNDSYIRILKQWIKNLKEKDPNKIDCWPHSTPYIQEMELMK